MNRQRFISGIILVIAVSLLAGCRGNPNVRKQRYLESGKRFSEDGKLREATIQFLNALKVDDDFADAHFQLAQTYERLGDFSSAIGELSRTTELQPANFTARVDLGNLLFASGRTDDAEAQADEVLAAQPNNPGVHALLSAIALRRGQKDQALSEIRSALDLDPNRAAFHDDLALLLSSDKSRNPAVEQELKKAVTLEPKSVNARLLLAAFYAHDNRLAEAEKTSWEAVAIDRRSLAARANLAQIILKEGDRARAEQVLREASKELYDDPQGVRLLADYYVDSGQLDKAKSEFSSLVVQYPRSDSARTGYIRVLLQAKDYASARTLISGMLKSGSRDPEVAALNGILLLNDGDKSDAISTLSDGARNFPKDFFLQYWLGKAALANGNSPLAEKSFHIAAELNPSAREAQGELAQIALQRGDANMLADVADNSIAASPRLPDGYVWRAIVEMQQNAVEKADADLRSATQVDPQCSQAYLELGKLRFAQKHYSQGVAFLEQALKFNPDSVEAIRLLIGYDLFELQPAAALARLNTQIQKSPAESCLYDLLAQLQIQNKNLDQAAASAQKAIQLDSSDGEAVLLYAKIAERRGQTASAISTWEQWSNDHPNDAGAYAILGTLEESKGELGKAGAYYKKSLQIQPQQPVAANNLAYQMLLDGETIDVALNLAQIARQGMPNSPNTADTLAWAYYYKENYEYARNLLEDATNANPDDAAMQYHLGMVYAKLRDKSSAALHLRRAQSLAHGSQIAKDSQAAMQGLG